MLSCPTATIPLSIYGGGSLQIYGSPQSERMLVLTSRENYNKDLELMDDIIHYFSSKGISIARYESHYDSAMRYVNRPFFSNYPLRIRQIIKTGFLLLRPQYWQYLNKALREKLRSLEDKKRMLSELMTYLEPNHKIIPITRSISGRIVSLIADDFNLQKIVCLGYPFEHPAEGPNTERYQHLETLKAEFLILQGFKDCYGGDEILGKYRFTPKTQIEFVQTDHDFTLTNAQKQKMLNIIDDFCTQ